jgi:hypothetical protein
MLYAISLAVAQSTVSTMGSAPANASTATCSIVLHLGTGSTGDEEPLVDAGVDGGRGLVLALGDVELAGVGTVLRVRDGDVRANLCQCMSLYGLMYMTYSERSPLGVLPVMSFSHASAHSRTMSVAYLSPISYDLTC